MTLKDLREAASMSQGDVAIALGVAPMTVSSWENGRQVPLPRYRLRLSQLFNVSIKEINEAVEKTPKIGRKK